MTKYRVVREFIYKRGQVLDSEVTTVSRNWVLQGFIQELPERVPEVPPEKNIPEIITPAHPQSPTIAKEKKHVEKHEESFKEMLERKKKALLKRKK